MKPKKKKLKWHRSNADIIKKLRQIAAAERKKKSDAHFIETLRQMHEATLKLLKTKPRRFPKPEVQKAFFDAFFFNK